MNNVLGTCHSDFLKPATQVLRISFHGYDLTPLCEDEMLSCHLWASFRVSSVKLVWLRVR